MNLEQSILREVIMFFGTAVIMPFLLVYGCLLFIGFFQLILPRELWQWILAKHDVEQMSMSSGFRPLLIGLLIGIYIFLFLAVNLFVYKNALFISRIVVNTGLLVGIIVTFKIMGKIGV